MSWSQRLRGPLPFVVGGLLALVLCLGLCSPLGSDDTDRAAAPSASSSPPGAPSLSPSASPSVPPSASPSASPSGATVAMPEVVGLRLDEAEQRVTAAGLTALRTTDVSGRDRMVLKKSNWVVREQDPTAGTQVTAAVTVVLSIGKPTDQTSSPQVVAGIVPDVVCLDLQAAQDALRAAGFYVLLAHDGTGRGRPALIDRNWMVIGQSVAAGTQPDPKRRIDLTVIKIDETSGATSCPS